MDDLSIDDLEISDLKTIGAREAAESLNFKSTDHFLKVWHGAGYRTFFSSPRKRVLLVADLARYLGERIAPLPTEGAAHV